MEGDPALLAGEDASSAPPRKKRRVSEKEVGFLDSSAVLSRGERRKVVPREYLARKVWGGDEEMESDEEMEGDEGMERDEEMYGDEVWEE